MKICVYGLVHNGQQYCEQWIDHVKDADYIVVGDIGSSDDTVKILESYGVIVVDLSIVRPWRYDIARNALLTKIPDDCDVAIVCDLNQELQHSWRNIITENWISGTDKISCKIQKTNGVHEWKYRIHSPKKYKWRRPIYEELESLLSEQIVFVNDIIIKDKFDSKYGDEDDLLNSALIERPEDSEIIWRLGSFYAVQHRWNESIDIHKKNIQSSSSLMYKSKSMISLSGLIQHECLSWLLRSVAESPWNKDAWLELAQYYYNNCEWVQLVACASKALELCDYGLTYQDTNWRCYVNDILSVAAWNANMKDLALKHSEIAAKLAPSDQRLQTNLMLIKNSLTKLKLSGE